VFEGYLVPMPIPSTKEGYYAYFIGVRSLPLFGIKCKDMPLLPFAFMINKEVLSWDPLSMSLLVLMP
jgi:hypothetical protein